MRTLDSGELGSAGGPGAGLGNRMDIVVGGYIAPRVYAPRERTTAADSVVREPKELGRA